VATQCIECVSRYGRECHMSRYHTNHAFECLLSCALCHERPNGRFYMCIHCSQKGMEKGIMVRANSTIFTSSSYSNRDFYLTLEPYPFITENSRPLSFIYISAFISADSLREYLVLYLRRYSFQYYRTHWRQSIRTLFQGSGFIPATPRKSRTLLPNPR
jgi:hypothetical protein